MTNFAIRAEGLGKRYDIGGTDVSYRMFRDVLREAMLIPVRRLRSVLAGQAIDSTQSVWALRDVSFEIRWGEAVGIIGRNGSGKSTLLKILSRITAPTEGQVRVRGRVGSLLEVGTGFHPELTGRENVYLNGAILGMARDETRKKFDDIVAFAEVEKFIDTPVKRYSSGMYMRLAFAVAAHLEPEILVVDEVLAVGDVAFQRKCLGKMNDVAHQGRTVLFVSHSIAAIENLCTKGIVLDQGKLVFSGTKDEAISNYLRSINNIKTAVIDRTDRQGSGDIKITSIALTDYEGYPLDSVASGQDIEIHLSFECKAGVTFNQLQGSLNIKTTSDMPVFIHHNRLSDEHFGMIPQRGTLICRIPHLPLTPASYLINAALSIEDKLIDYVENAARFEVIAGDFFGTGELPSINQGPVLVKANWRLQSEHVTDPQY